MVDKRAKLIKAKSATAHTGITDNLPESAPSRSKTWAGCMKRILEINPLECPKCEADMRIVSFLTDTREINKIMKSLGIPGPEPPKKIPITKQPYEYDPQVDISYDEF